MYTKRNSIFSRGKRTLFYKNGVEIACRDDGEEINILWSFYADMQAQMVDADKYNTYRQVYGWRYWRKHFPNRFYYDLPKQIIELLDLPCDTYGTYINKAGEVVGYEA